jgi:hypothetical protein
MNNPTSKELYFMNGGRTHYIYTDGFGDIYHVTPAEEMQWQKELIESKLERLDMEKDPVVLKAILDTLIYHKAPNLQQIVTKKLPHAAPRIQIALVKCLWEIGAYPKSLSVLFSLLNNHRAECINDVFSAMFDMKDDREIRNFLLTCLEGEDVELFNKAHIVLNMWAYMGIPALRQGTLLQDLNISSKQSNLSVFQAALQELKHILAQ